MARHQYRYMLLRYIADLERMEPCNIGIIVQSEDGIAHRINARFQPDRALRPDFDRINFKAWRQYLTDEISRTTPSAFAPSRDSEDYLAYLQSRFRANYQLSEILHYEGPEDGVQLVANALFARLVARRPREATEVPQMPVDMFRYQIRERSLLRRYPQLRHNEYVQIGQSLQPFYYSYANGRMVLIDKVEISEQIRYTQLELDSLVARLEATRNEPGRREVIAVLDPVDSLPDPADAATERLRLAYDRGVAKIRRLADRVLDRADNTQRYVAELEEELAAEHQG